MLISMNWISDFVDLSGLNKEELIKRFTLSTAEVEEIFNMGEDLKDVVAAKIISVENHPDSKKLHLLKVDAGDKIYDVVCGAPNVREGLIVPFVKVGGKVGGHDINVAKVAGYESFGMCCSELELGISADHAGLMELEDNVALGTDITEIYAIKDTVFEVDNKSLTNRPDLWGHYGIAREFATLTGRPLKPIEQLDLSAYSSLPEIDIKVLDEEFCFRYSGLKVRNITKKVSPADMRIRLFYCGTRAINLLADLTNYLMLELGQPMHAFDAAKVDCIEVQRFGNSFEFETLDEVKRQIDENTLMITSNNKPVAIAGIMGGLDSEIEDSTDSLLLESANFDAVCVRKSSTRLALRTDASMRYEKTLDPEITTAAIARFMKILTEIDSGVEIISSLTDVYVKKYPKISLDFNKAYVNRYTGIDIENDEILKTLNALGFSAKASGDDFNVEIPSWRATKDVTIKADIIEEITRIYGYDNFKIDTTKSALFPVKKSLGNKADNFAKDILVETYALHEVNSYIWSDRKKLKDIGIEIEPNVRLVNAQTPDHEVIRNSMIPTLLSFVNDNRSFSQDFGIFEIARVVEGLKENKECNERKKLGIVLYSRTKSEKELYFEILNMVNVLANDIKHIDFAYNNSEVSHTWQHPMNTAEISYNGEKLGFVSTIHPQVLQKIDKKASVVTAEIDMDNFSAIKTADIRYAEPSKYPGIDIDLSISIKSDTIFSELEQAWKALEENVLKNVSLFDSFEENGNKSITLRFSFVSDEKTLSKEEVQPYIDEILTELAKSGIELKS